MTMRKARRIKLVDEAAALADEIVKMKNRFDEIKAIFRDEAEMTKVRRFEGSEKVLVVSERKSKVIDLHALWHMCERDFDEFVELVRPNQKSIRHYCDVNDFYFSDCVSAVEVESYKVVAIFDKKAKAEKPKKKVKRTARHIDL